MRFKIRAFGLFFFMWWPFVATGAVTFRDSSLTYNWIQSLAEQDNPKLNAAILSLVNDYERHFPNSFKNAKLLQIKGTIYVHRKQPYRAFVSFLKQRVVYPTETSNYQSEKMVAYLALTQKKIRQRRESVANFLNTDCGRFSFKRRMICFLNQLYWLDIPEIDTIALQEIDFLLNLGLSPAGLDEIVYEKAQILRRKGQARAALQAYIALLHGWPKSDYFPLGVYHIAELLKNGLKQKRWASIIFRTFVTKFPEHYLTELAYLHLAQLDEESGTYQKAVQDYVCFLNHSSEKIWRALAYYRLSRLFGKRLGDEQRARVLYRKFVELYPSEKAARRAVKQIRMLK